MLPSQGRGDLHEARRHLFAGQHVEAGNHQPAPRAGGGRSQVRLAVNTKEFDMVAAWSVDRLGRSLTDLLGILQQLHDKRVDLFLHQQGLDTSTTAGKAMFQMLGVFAEFERGIIRERVNAGLARASASGIKLGRRPVKPTVETRIRRLRADGMGILKIGRY